VAFLIRTKLLKQDLKPSDSRAVFVLVGRDAWSHFAGGGDFAAGEVGNGQPFGEKNLIVFLTFSVILVTLVVQGLTLPPLIRALGLAGDDEARIEEEEARRLVLQEVMSYLQEGWERMGKTRLMPMRTCCTSMDIVWRR